MKSVNQWVKAAMASNGYDADLVKGMYPQACTEAGFTIKYKSFMRAIQRSVKSSANDSDILGANIALAKKVQKFQDTNRIERAAFRTVARQENAMEEYNKSLISVIKRFSNTDYSKIHDVTISDGVGIIHLTDLHGGERINLPQNQYDYTVASQRLKIFASEAKVYFNSHGVKKVVIAMTGDIINNDSITDKLLNNSMNRSKATLMMAQLLRQFTLDINEDFAVHITGVSGNESRILPDIGFAENVASHNFDYTILQILKIMFENSKGIEVFECGYNEGVVNIQGKNILLMHGHTTKGTSLEKYVQLVRGRFASGGVMIDYVLLGHLHSTCVGNTFARGASLCGGNDYSQFGLNLDSKASQNLILVTERSINVQMVDLQEVKGVVGYPINVHLEEYNSKSYDKLVRYESVYKV